MAFPYSAVMVDVAPDFFTAGVACCRVIPVSGTLIYLYIDCDGKQVHETAILALNLGLMFGLTQDSCCLMVWPVIFKKSSLIALPLSFVKSSVKPSWVIFSSDVVTLPTYTLSTSS